MADFFHKIVEKRANQKERFYEQFSSPESISKALNRKLFRLAILGFFCNLFTWLVWIRKFFPDDEAGSFMWYVLLPLIIQESILIVYTLLCILFGKVIEKGTNRAYLHYSILGSIAYSAFFSCLIYFYRQMPIFWLFAVCPMLLSAFYRRNIWFVTSLTATALSIVVITMGHMEISTYRIDNVPPSMLATESVIISLIVGAFTVALHTRIEMVIKDIAKAEATEQAKAAFFAKMSHEIRTPINAVLGMDEMILRENISPEVHGYAENIKTAGNSLLSIVNDILDSSRLETGRLEILPSEYELLSLINDCYNLVKVRAIEKGLDFKVTNDPTLPKLLVGDEVRVRQIVSNILTNAVKYTRVGHITFNIGWEKIADNVVNLIVRVEDTGIGISEAGKEHLFESFERLDERNNKYIEGTGLGLSISKQLCDLMDGTIKVESEVGKGSVFTVTIPQGCTSEAPLGDFYARIQALNTKDKAVPEKFTASFAKVLVVDDVQLNIDVFRGLLKKTKIHIDAALSGEEALSLIKKKRYDIIFMDHLMPGLDGVETLKRMQEMDHVNVDTPVIVLTANVTPDSEKEYRACGFTEYVPKPVKGKVLEEVVYRYLKDVEKNGSEEEQKSPETASEALLSKLAFLDTAMGLSCCGNDVVLYKEIVSEYVNDDRSEKLDELYKAQNWNEYKVQIHAVKSSALSIGAMDLSDKAKKIEACINELDLETVLNSHEGLLSDYKEIMTKVSSALS